MSQVQTLWRAATALPVLRPVGARVFSVAFARKAPYFATVRPRFAVLEPDHVELVVPKRRAVHNHLGTVHAIALCNGLEAAMGALAEVSIAPAERWIPRGMQVEYTAKATSDITCVAETDRSQWTAASATPTQTGYDVAVRVRGVRDDGAVVVRGTIDLWVTARR